MADYTPPAANAVNFDFTLSPYTPPAANAVNFDFVASPSIVVAAANSRMFLVF